MFLFEKYIFLLGGIVFTLSDHPSTILFKDLSHENILMKTRTRSEEKVKLLFKQDTIQDPFEQFFSAVEHTFSNYFTPNISVSQKHLSNLFCT